MPAACDKQGAGPCGTDTGTNQPSTDDNQTPGSTSSTGPGGSQSSSGPGGSGPSGSQNAPPTDPAQQGVDPATGATVTQADGSSAVVYANATTLVSDRPAQDRAFGWLAALELLALVLVPGIYVASRARRQQGDR